MELVVFLIAGLGCLAGALGVVFSRNPVHAALSLVGTLFGIAVLFVAQNANFLAAVQVIVYAGAIVVLFLFVLMLLGVDRAENLNIEPLGGQRIAALFLSLGILALPLLAFSSTEGEATGARAAQGATNEISKASADVSQLGQSLFTTYLFAFEVTSVLLVIAVVGAVIMSRKIKRADLIDDPLVALAAEREAVEGYAKGGRAPLDAQAGDASSEASEVES